MKKMDSATAMRETLQSTAKRLMAATEDENFGMDALYLVGCMRTVAADCLAAALKWKAVCMSSSQDAGNAAAMREALEIAKRAICHHAKYICQSLAWENSTINANCADILCSHRELCEAKTAINAALAAPPRNCDLPLVVDGPANNNADKAWRVFKRHNPGAYFDVPGLLRCIDWLLAPATEQKGENDGIK